MLWIETSGTYKFRGVYNSFRWDFCDLHCQLAYFNKLDWDGIEVAKHKIKKKSKKVKEKNA